MVPPTGFSLVFSALEERRLNMLGHGGVKGRGGNRKPVAGGSVPPLTVRAHARMEFRFDSLEKLQRLALPQHRLG